MATTYTQRFRLNKPDFRTSPWSSQLNDNTDRLDSIIYNALLANNISTYTNDVDVEAGQIMYDPELETFWLCRVSHTTAETGTFEDERSANPSYWTTVQFGLNPRGQWQQETAYAYYDLAYDVNENIAGFCLVPHVSPDTGTMRDEAEKWALIIDLHVDNVIGASDIFYDDVNVPFTADNVQTAIDETNERIDNAATIVEGVITDVATNTSDIASLTTTTNNQGTSIDTLEARSITGSGLASGGGDLTADRAIAVEAATQAEIWVGTANKAVANDVAWDAIEWQDMGNATGALTIDAENGIKQLFSLTGNVVVSMSNLKNGQTVEIGFIQDATGGRTIGWNASILFPNGVAPAVTSTAGLVALIATIEYIEPYASYIANGWKLN